ncbi:MAG TPA: histidine kinase N-terminal 7TM domain-containing protein, partial [Anaerolineales bacterium]
MSREQFLHLAPYVISVAVLTGVFLYAVRERYIRGARPFAWIVAGQLLTSLAFIFELVSPSMEIKILWDTV